MNRERTFAFMRLDSTMRMYGFGAGGSGGSVEDVGVEFVVVDVEAFGSCWITGSAIVFDFVVKLVSGRFSRALTEVAINCCRAQQ